jgi:hypothetical protein
MNIINICGSGIYSLFSKHFIYNPIINIVRCIRNFFVYKILEKKVVAKTFPIPNGNTTCINAISIVSGSGPPSCKFILSSFLSINSGRP